MRRKESLKVIKQWGFMLNGLDLFTGIGGLSLALKQWVRPIAYCENDRYAQSVLLSRMQDWSLPRAPIWDDITSLDGTMLPEIDIIYGGFPCQDISCAGVGKGLAGERSGLYWQIERLVKETKPKFVFLENVPAIRTRGLNAVVQSLTELGYDCRWTVVSAAEVGAPHLRKRWFLLAHASGTRRWQDTGGPYADEGEHAGRAAQKMHKLNGNGEGDRAGPVADPNRTGFEFNSQMHTRGQCVSGGHTVARSSWWDVEPNVGRVAHGVSSRVDRLRGLGNSVVPLQAKTAFERLMGLGD